MEVICVKEGKEYIQANYPNDPLLKHIATNLLDQLPKVDAEPVVHGRWEWLGPYRYIDDGMIGTCSVCKERVRLFATNYCPNCGVLMTGGRNNG